MVAIPLGMVIAVERKRKPTRPLDRARWIDAALAAIETGGPDAVAVGPLARSLGVTKGSFYWHFADRQELLRAALGTWLTRHTVETERRFGAISDPHQRLCLLFRYAVVELRPTVIVQLLAHVDDPDVAIAVNEATRRRLEFIAAAYRELGLSPAAARDQALLAYSAFLGFAQLIRDPNPAVATRRQLHRLLKHTQRALIDVYAMQD
jgi:AcrR family transcriptional regulator